MGWRGQQLWQFGLEVDMGFVLRNGGEFPSAFFEQSVLLFFFHFYL